MIREPSIIRASSTSGWSDCNRRGAARVFRSLVVGMGYTLREIPVSVGAAVGTGVHAGAAHALAEKAKGHAPSASAASDVAVEALRERKAGEGMRMDDETPTMRDAEHQVVRMTGAYLRHVAPKVEPILVETRLEATVPWTHNEFVLSGQADVLAREPGRVRDLKTGKRRGHHRPQLGSYGLLARTHPDAQDVRAAAEDYIRRSPLAKPQEQPQSIDHSLAGCEAAAIAVIKHMDSCLTTFLEGDPSRAILPGDPWAFTANPSSMLCSEKWCPAWGTAFCREHDGAEEPLRAPRPPEPEPVASNRLPPADAGEPEIAFLASPDPRRTRKGLPR